MFTTGIDTMYTWRSREVSTCTSHGQLSLGSHVLCTLSNSSPVQQPIDPHRGTLAGMLLRQWPVQPTVTSPRASGRTCLLHRLHGHCCNHTRAACNCPSRLLSAVLRRFDCLARCYTPPLHPRQGSRGERSCPSAHHVRRCGPRQAHVSPCLHPIHPSHLTARPAPHLHTGYVHSMLRRDRHPDGVCTTLAHRHQWRPVRPQDLPVSRPLAEHPGRHAGGRGAGSPAGAERPAPHVHRV